MRGVSLLTAAAESVVVQTPVAVGRTLSSTTAVAAPSQRRSSRPMPPLDVPLTFSTVPAGSTNTSTDGSVTGSLMVVAVTAAPAATGAASAAATARLRRVRRLVTTQMMAHDSAIADTAHTICTVSKPGAHPPAMTDQTCRARRSRQIAAICSCAASRSSVSLTGTKRDSAPSRGTCT